MRRLAFLISLCLLISWAITGRVWAESGSGQRIDSRYCTLWFESGVNLEKVNRRISVRGLSRLKLPKGSSVDQELASKCDILFERAEEVLDMFPPGIHVTLQVTENRDTISAVHAGQYGHGTEAIAIYLFERNTIYAWSKEISESVLIHEMAHCILDHYFQVRPPRKIEELLAMHVDAQMRE